jgi:deoxyribodipyrimidine photo-lyase
VQRVLGREGIDVRAFKDSVVFEEHEILTGSSDSPYTVYSPYKNAWWKKFKEEGLEQNLKVWGKPELKFPKALDGGADGKHRALPTLKWLGFERIEGMEIEPGEAAGRKMLWHFCERRLGKYANTRNFPAMGGGSSRVSPHFRHGTISVRQALKLALDMSKEGGATVAKGAEVWMNELVWREFYQQILFNFPDVQTRPFKKKFENLKWRRKDEEFNWWTEGKTGYPIVDAGMRQLNASGWMHNRVRMITANFLTKDQRIDYQWGERYFAQRLIDFEVAQNNGNWQWSAGTGTDAQPYFRIFNPASQSLKFDPKGAYIRKWVPELGKVPAKFIHEPHLMSAAEQDECGCRIGRDYPGPVVDHGEARKKALSMFEGVK